MQARGFTLVETIVTLLVAAILLSLAVPAFQSLFVNNRLATQANELVSDLNAARSEAIRRGTPVSLCPSNAGTGCSGTNWADGRLVFVDGGVAGVLDGTDEVLRVQPALQGNLTLTQSGFGGVDYVHYRADGSVAAAGSFTLCRSGFTGRRISVSATGRPRTEPTAGLCP